jgi:hypothetical protein
MVNLLLDYIYQQHSFIKNLHQVPVLESFLRPKFTDICNKLVFVSDKPSIMFVGEARSLPANIRLCWKGLPETNTLAYYENSLITAVKSLIV